MSNTHDKFWTKTNENHVKFISAALLNPPTSIGE